MIINDIDIMKQKLYNAIEKGDDYSIYEISVELDSLIVEFYKIFKIWVINIIKRHFRLKCLFLVHKIFVFYINIRRIFNVYIELVYISG